ncbi:endothelial cell-selective adhesion molecule-like isoform X2 [Carcharodon carcharias]|uniref:endothelial cell-selective adhesion molecule-like isoform X2 n=1 Tax=Carcharodon carcharias TaxID=13397 RepID=UPI001B7E8F86|nr:endothelial cell-selective adhesion molecule-like isoform X2 [Carcharodon carcharias]
MNAVQLTLWALLLVTPTLFNGVGSKKSLVMPERQIVSIGHSVVLSSRIPSNLTPISVSWFKENAGQILLYTDQGIIPGDGYQNRVGLKHSMPSRDVSIYINNTNLSDSGLYTCSVGVAISNLGTFINGATYLAVLIPPSPPECNIIGNQYVGSNVTLTCHSATGKPAPKYTWKRDAFKPGPISFRGRNVKMGSLTLTNLSEALSGLYTCKSENEIGNASCSVQLNVMMPSNAGIIAGAIIGVFLGMCLIIAIAIYFCRLQKKREAEKEQYLANEIKEDAQAPTGNTWAKTASSDIISKNGTLSSMNSTMHAYKPYPKKPPSDTASTITAMGVNSTGSYKRPSNAQKSAGNTPTRSSPGQSVPAYASLVNTHHSGPPPKWQNGVQAQAPSQAASLSSMSPSNLARMGAVAVMVPAQNQAGSLV